MSSKTHGGAQLPHDPKPHKQSVHKVLDAGSLPHARYGIPSGVAGAGVVALFFLLFDSLAGRPFATPAALGATLFLGHPFDLATEPQGALIAAYTAVHGVIFVAIASLLTIGLFSGSEEPRPSWSLWLSLTGIGFLLCEIFFVGFTLLAGESMWAGLGFLRITLANALAAAGMAAMLTWFVARALLDPP